jgi:hypothetical protein
MTAVFFVILLVADLLAVVFQANCQPIPYFMDARVLIYPVILAYGALALPFAGTLALAFFNGLVWAALNVAIVNPDPIGQKAAIVEIPIGWFIILYGLLAVFVHGLRPLFLRGRWDIHCLASGFCTVVILLSEYLMLAFQRPGLVFPKELLARIFLPGFFAMLLAVGFYFFFNYIAGLLNYPVRIDDDRDRSSRAR